MGKMYSVIDESCDKEGFSFLTSLDFAPGRQKRGDLDTHRNVALCDPCCNSDDFVHIVRNPDSLSAPL